MNLPSVKAIGAADLKTSLFLAQNRHAS